MVVMDPPERTPPPSIEPAVKVVMEASELMRPRRTPATVTVVMLAVRIDALAPTLLLRSSMVTRPASRLPEVNARLNVSVVMFPPVPMSPVVFTMPLNVAVVIPPST